MNDIEKAKFAIDTLRKMQKKRMGDTPFDAQYEDGLVKGQGIAFGVAADLLSDLFKLEEEEQ